ncbi:MAG: hypothetical protein EZS28_005210, partial [Streblomastix strix]
MSNQQNLVTVLLVLVASINSLQAASVNIYVDDNGNPADSTNCIDNPSTPCKTLSQKYPYEYTSPSSNYNFTICIIDQFTVNDQATIGKEGTVHGITSYQDTRKDLMCNSYIFIHAGTFFIESLNLKLTGIAEAAIISQGDQTKVEIYNCFVTGGSIKQKLIFKHDEGNLTIANLTISGQIIEQQSFILGWGGINIFNDLTITGGSQIIGDMWFFSLIGGNTFFNNFTISGGEGGAIYAWLVQSGQLKIDGNVKFKECNSIQSSNSGGRGGSIYLSLAQNSTNNFTIGNQVQFIDNKAQLFGRDIFIYCWNIISMNIQQRILININSPSYNKTNAIYGTEFGADSELGRKPLIDYDLSSIIISDPCSSITKDTPISQCQCLSEEDPRAGTTCPSYCKSKAELTSDCVCDPNSTSYPSSDCEKDKLCTYDIIHQNISYCPCQSTGDPRNGSFCPVYCMKGYVSINCVCDTNSTIFPLAQCQKDMLCATDLVHQSASDCPCLPTGDPRAGNTCPAYCTAKDTPNANCACDSNPNAQYPLQTCQSDKKCTASSSSTVPTDSCTCSGTNYPSGCKCPTDSSQLINIPTSQCQCSNISDPRAGTTCPAYCIGPDIPTSSCVCDLNPNVQYPPQLCQSDKKCTAQSGSSVPQDSCSCIESNYPYGCKCPTNSSQLIGIPQSICDCRTTQDPRAGGACPTYCVRGQTNVNCICDTGSSSYPYESCEKDKKCIIDLIHQSKADCPCLMKGDPRAGDICPSYCISKVELTIDCMCELGSSYPQATCERDKLCIVDLIHQSTSNCPCLEVDDPRGEQVCKQIEINPTDPDILDPTEKDPEDDQKPEEIIKE